MVYCYRVGSLPLGDWYSQHDGIKTRERDEYGAHAHDFPVTKPLPTGPGEETANVRIAHGTAIYPKML